ncbi:MAG: transketolase C-terminal domain-containing protein, partial [Bacteroidales bacterium]
MSEIFQSRGCVPTKEGFGKGVLSAAMEYMELVGIGADITASVGMNLFAEAFPERFFSLGIAEQNCIGVAAGMALEGFLPVFSTYGVFAAHRAADQIRISLCYNNLHVIIGGAHGGISVGPDGATHQALEDLATMRVLPNMTVLSPCDATQTAIAVKAAVKGCPGPVYIRFGRNPIPDFTAPDQIFTLGKGDILHEGEDACIIATGSMVWEALQAAYALKQAGIACRVINIHTIKPLDENLLFDCARRFSFIVTAEEHQVATALPNPPATWCSSAVTMN